MYTFSAIIVIGHRRSEAAMEARGLGRWRRERLLTIRGLAEAAGVSPRTVLLVEHGQQVPRPGTIRKLAAALGVEPAQVREFRAAMGLDDAEGERA